MKLADVWQQAAVTLSGAGFDLSELEAEVILRHVLKISRVELFSSLNKEIEPEKYIAFQQLLDQRLRKRPVAYITGVKEFYNVELYVDERVLIPRPETELLVEESLSIIKNKANPLVCDLGTGSGAIAVTLAVNHPKAKVYAIDISPEVLRVAGINRDKYQLEDRVVLVEGDLLSACPEPVDIIAANLPYVKSDDLALSAFEPISALDGGRDGLDIIQRLLLQFTLYLKSGGSLLLEIGCGQDVRVQAFISNRCPGYQVSVKNDLAGIPRVLIVTSV